MTTKKVGVKVTGIRWDRKTKKLTPTQEKRAEVDAKVKKFLAHFRARLEKAVARGDAEPIDEAEWRKLEKLAYKLAK